MNRIKETSLVIGLGFLADRALDVLGDILPPVAEDSREVLRSLSEAIKLLYCTDASDLALRNADYLHLSTGGLKDAIQRAAAKEGRMASYLADEVAITLEVLAMGAMVSGQKLERARCFLLFVASGTLTYVNILQESRVPHYP